MHHVCFNGVEEAERILFKYIGIYYNQRRKLQSKEIGLTPKFSGKQYNVILILRRYINHLSYETTSNIINIKRINRISKKRIGHKIKKT